MSKRTKRKMASCQKTADKNRKQENLAYANKESTLMQNVGIIADSRNI